MSKFILFILLLMPSAGCLGTRPSVDAAPEQAYSARTPGSAFKLLISALNNADFDSAYNALSEGTRCRYALDEFTNFFMYDDFGREFRRLLIQSKPVTIAYREDENAAVITVLLDGRLKSFNLVKEDSSWKFDFNLEELY